MITHNGYFVIYNSILLCILSIIFSFSWLYIFSISFITLTLIEALRFIRTLNALKYLEIRRILDDKCFRNSPIKIELEIKSIKDIPYVVIIDEIPSGFFYYEGKLGFNGKLKKGITKISYYLLPKEIGVHEFQTLKIVAFDPFQFFFVKKEYKYYNKISCYPSVSAQISNLIRSAILYSEYGLKSTRRKGEGFEFYSSREYTIGDDLRRIAWRQVAKSPERKLYIIEKEEEGKNVFRTVVIIEDTMFEGKEGERKIDILAESIITFASVALKYNTYLEFIFLYNNNVDQFSIKNSIELYNLIKYLGEIKNKPTKNDINKLVSLLSKYDLNTYFFFICDRGIINNNILDLFIKCKNIRFEVIILRSFHREDIKDNINSILYSSENICLNMIKEEIEKYNISTKIIFQDDIIKEIVRAYNNMRYRSLIEYETRKI
jgi:hypothetical protein